MCALSSQAVKKIEGPLLFLEPLPNVRFNELVNITKPSGEIVLGRCVIVSTQAVVIEVFRGTDGLDLASTSVEFTADTFRMALSQDMVGRTFDGMGFPIDGGPEIIPEVWADINGDPINPFAREYPRELIETGVSSIDTLTTLVCGQKLPIFSGQGLPHDELAAKIVKYGKIYSEEARERFLIIFAGIGIKNDTAIYFRNQFERTESKVISFINLANDPTIERLLVPKLALTTAEYFAFSKNYNVLVILTDMTNYCEALREISASKDEVPSRKGYPGYMYSDLASNYERAGRIKGMIGSITQLPIVTMPNDDIGHPIPDLTGYITEGQVVLSRGLYGKGITPPVDILASLSRLMKDAIVGKTRDDHGDVMGQLYASYSKALDVRNLQAIVGDEGLSPLDKKYLHFADEFESRFLTQGMEVRHTFNESFDLAWDLLSILPSTELIRIKKKFIELYYKEKKE
jgi:V/A-type H+-transporting ATPase subunit B